jgi:protein-arginine kinase activator protein McsA
MPERAAGTTRDLATCPECGHILTFEDMARQTIQPVFWCPSCEKWFAAQLSPIEASERWRFYKNLEIG